MPLLQAVGRRAARARAFLLLAVGMAACGDATGISTGFPPGTHVLSGAGGGTDTIGAILPETLVVVLRDRNGFAEVDAPVRFTSPPIDPMFSYSSGVSVSALDHVFFRPSTELRTDSSGRARVLVKLGNQTTTAARLIVSTLQSTDTIRYTVLAGNAASIALTLRDTTVYPGAAFSVKATVTDRFGNVPVTPVHLFSRQPEVADIDAAGRVTTMSVGRGYLVAASGSYQDSLGVSVVPHGTILAYVHIYSSGDRATFYLFDLDGSNYRVVGGSDYSYNNRSPFFLPAGDRVVFHAPRPNDDQMLVTSFAMELAGQVTPVMALTSTVTSAVRPQPSRDGSWVYFQAGKGYQWQEIWRVHPDGTGAEAVGLDSRYEPLYGEPSPSPDGTRLAVAVATYSRLKNALGIFDLRTHTLTTIPGDARRPRWSPVGEEIAAFSGDSLRILRSDGTAVLPPIAAGSGRFDSTDGQVDWSPDGQWLIACATGQYLGQRYLVLIRRSDGVQLPLEHTRSRNLCDATWKPR